nr:hypothetical protein [Mucilaginibacter sp. L294]
MNTYFPIDNNSNKLFQEIGKTINEFYPLGVDRESPTYNNHSGICAIQDKINYQMLNYNKHIKGWKSFLKSLPRGFKSKIHDHSFAHEISFSGEMTLERTKYEKISLEKKLYFSVSGIANYFNIHGIDETWLTLNEDGDRYNRYSYSAINAITISPYMEFEKPFKYVYEAIIEHFPDHNFVPFEVCQMPVKGLQTPNSNLEECTVYNALFRDIYDYQCLGRLRGDRFNKFRKGNINVRIDPPSTSG